MNTDKTTEDDNIPMSVLHIAVKQDEVHGQRVYSLFSLCDTEISPCPQAQFTKGKLVRILQHIENDINRTALRWFLGEGAPFGTITRLTVEFFSLDGTESLKVEGNYPIILGMDFALIMCEDDINDYLDTVNSQKLLDANLN